MVLVLLRNPYKWVSILTHSSNMGERVAEVFHWLVSSCGKLGPLTSLVVFIHLSFLFLFFACQLKATLGNGQEFKSLGHRLLSIHNSSAPTPLVFL